MSVTATPGEPWADVFARESIRSGEAHAAVCRACGQVASYDDAHPAASMYAPDGWTGTSQGWACRDDRCVRSLMDYVRRAEAWNAKWAGHRGWMDPSAFDATPVIVRVVRDHDPHIPVPQPDQDEVDRHKDLVNRMDKPFDILSRYGVK